MKKEKQREIIKSKTKFNNLWFDSSQFVSIRYVRCPSNLLIVSPVQDHKSSLSFGVWILRAIDISESIGQDGQNNIEPRIDYIRRPKYR